jgi:hypothetical protein
MIALIPIFNIPAINVQIVGLLAAGVYYFISLFLK